MAVRFTRIHDWGSTDETRTRPAFPLIRNHVLLVRAGRIEAGITPDPAAELEALLRAARTLRCLCAACCSPEVFLQRQIGGRSGAVADDSPTTRKQIESAAASGCR
jgi:hypothetical protein